MFLLVALLQRLAAKEWTSRVSATRLFAIAYPRAPAPVQAELRATFIALCQDDTPMVRRAASQCLGHLAEVIHDAEIIRQELLPAFSDLTHDGEPRALPESICTLA